MICLMCFLKLLFGKDYTSQVWETFACAAPEKFEVSYLTGMGLLFDIRSFAF